jgi:hypothetical protein
MEVIYDTRLKEPLPDEGPSLARRPHVRIHIGEIRFAHGIGRSHTQKEREGSTIPISQLFTMT